MDDAINNKIKNILKKLEEAVGDYSRRFIKPVIEHGELKPVDIFDMAIAQEKIDAAENQFEIYLSEKYPNGFSEEYKEFLIKDKSRLAKRLHAWTNRQIPTRE